MVTSRSQTIRRRLGSVTLTGQGLGLGLGTSLFPVGATEIKDLPWQPSRRIAGFDDYILPDHHPFLCASLVSLLPVQPIVDSLWLRTHKV